MTPWAKPVFWGNEQRYVDEALSSTWISGGPFVDRLEREMARYCGRPHAITSSNGTSALEMLFLALDLGPGDEIIVPGFAFMAAANVALHRRARPVFADVDRETWCLDSADVGRRITPRTKAIVAVHSYGNLCDTDALLAVAGSRGITVIEDAAESFASRDRGRLAGTIAPFGTYSFQATKTISTGEGGMVVTADAQVNARMQLFRNHGMAERRYWHEVPGHNFRLTNLQAALGCAQLEKLDLIIAARRRVHMRYREHLDGQAGLEAQRFLDSVEPVLWAFAVRLEPGAYPQGRDAVMLQLAEAGIETRPGFYYAGSMPHLYSECPSLPVSLDLSRQVISLPTFPTLDDEEISRISDRLRSLRR